MSEQMMHPGATGFDLGDRLAVINLCNAYARYYDANDLDQWFQMFTDDIKCTVCLSASDPNIVEGEAFRDLFRSLRAQTADGGVAPLHCNTNLTVTHQTTTQASAECYVIYVPLEIAALNSPETTRLETRITGTARYRFDMLKGQDGQWRINNYLITYDQQVVEHSLEA